jgi:hypothetical protein
MMFDGSHYLTPAGGMIQREDVRDTDMKTQGGG